MYRRENRYMGLGGGVMKDITGSFFKKKINF
jgi:hypothetical protein